MKTFGEILKAGLELHGECPKCDRKDKLNLDGLKSEARACERRQMLAQRNGFLSLDFNTPNREAPL